MKILALDTSSTACSVALLSDSEAKTRHEVIPLQHAKRILPFIDEMLGPEAETLDALAWGCGPGSFTGLRIAASVIQALGFAHKLPVISISSMAALAQTVYEERGWKEMLVAIDARMQEVYWGAYCINSQGYAELIGSEGRCAPEAVPVTAIHKANGYGVGDAWSQYVRELSERLEFGPERIDAASLPKALAVARLARLKYQKAEWVQAFDALPRYLRDNIVT